MGIIDRMGEVYVQRAVFIEDEYAALEHEREGVR
jgi:hypothetical protein